MAFFMHTLFFENVELLLLDNNTLNFEVIINE